MSERSASRQRDNLSFYKEALCPKYDKDRRRPDPRFEPLNAALSQVEEIAWQNYQEGRKAPVTQKAGSEFADRYVGYYESYAESHMVRDKDEDFHQEVRNVARAPATLRRLALARQRYAVADRQQRQIDAMILTQLDVERLQGGGVFVVGAFQHFAIAQRVIQHD